MSNQNVGQERNALSVAPADLAPGATLDHDPRLGVPERVRAVRVDSLSQALSANAPTPLGMLKAFRRRMNLALLVGIVGATAAAAAAWFLVPEAKYTTKAVLRLSAQKPQVLFRTIETEASGGDEYKRYQQTQIALLRSRNVLNAALSLDGMEDVSGKLSREHEDPIEWLREHLEIGFESGSELLNVSMSGEDPEAITRLVNAIRQAYMEEVADSDLGLRRDRYDLIRQLRTKKAEELKVQRERLRRIAEQLGSDHRETLALKQQFAMQQLSMVEQELLEVESQKRRAEAELAMLEKARGAEVTVPRATRPSDLSAKDRLQKSIDAHPSMVEARLAVQDAESAYQQYYDDLSRRSRKSASDPSLKPFRARVLQARERVESLRTELIPTIEAESKGPKLNAQIDPVAEVEARIGMLDDLKNRLMAVKGTLGEGNQKMTVETLDLQDLQDKVGQLQATSDKMAAEEEALSVELQAPRRVEKIEDAVIPKIRDTKKRYLMILMATLAAFLAGVGGITFLEFRARKVDSIDDVAMGLGIQIMGVLPNLPPRVRRVSAGALRPRDKHWHALMLESIDATRTLFLHLTQQSKLRVIMVTSALGGEGKTSLSCHLATSLARAGRTTLLIDADLRRPSLARLLDLTMTTGLSEVLRGEATIDEVIESTVIPGLLVINAGEYDDATLFRLAAGGMTPVLDELRKRFDYVIVDSSPILPVADTLVIAQAVDGVVFSVLQDISRMPKVLAAHQRLASLSVPVLGAVVTGASGGLYGNDYYYAARPKETSSAEEGESS